MSEKFNWDLPPGEKRIRYVADQMYNILNEISARFLLVDDDNFDINIEIANILDYINGQSDYDHFHQNDVEYKRPTNLSQDEVYKYLTEDTDDTDA